MTMGVFKDKGVDDRGPPYRRSPVTRSIPSFSPLLTAVYVAASENDGDLDAKAADVSSMAGNVGDDAWSMPCPSLPMRTSPLSLRRILIVSHATS